MTGNENDIQENKSKKNLIIVLLCTFALVFILLLVVLVNSSNNSAPSINPRDEQRVNDFRALVDKGETIKELKDDLGAPDSKSEIEKNIDSWVYQVEGGGISVNIKNNKVFSITSWVDTPATQSETVVEGEDELGGLSQSPPPEEALELEEEFEKKKDKKEK